MRYRDNVLAAETKRLAEERQKMADQAIAEERQKSARRWQIRPSPKSSARMRGYT